MYFCMNCFPSWMALNSLLCWCAVKKLLTHSLTLSVLQITNEWVNWMIVTLRGLIEWLTDWLCQQYVNPACAKVLHYNAPAELVGRHVDEALTSDKNPIDIYSKIQQQLQSGQVCSVLYTSLLSRCSHFFVKTCWQKRYKLHMYTKSFHDSRPKKTSKSRLTTYWPFTEEFE